MGFKNLYRSYRFIFNSQKFIKRYLMSNTRIVATVGPATCSEKSLLALKEAGVNIIRLNGSHNTLEWHADVVKMVHEILPSMPILLDIKVPL